MTQQRKRPSDEIAKRYSLPDRLKRAKPEGFSAAADYRERQRKKREAEESD